MKSFNRDVEEFEDFEIFSESNLNDTISFLKKLQSEAKIGSNEYKAYGEQIAEFERKLIQLKQATQGVTGVLNDLEFIEPEDENIDFDINVTLNTKGVDSVLAQLAQKTKTPIEEIEELWAGMNEKNFQNALIFAEKYIDLNEDIKEKQSQIYEGIGDVVGETLNSILEIQLNKLDEQSEANDEYYERLLDRENLTDEERDRIEKQRDEKDKQLRKKRQKIEKQQFLLGQLSEVAFVTIDMFKAIAAIKAQAAILAANPVTAALAPLALSQIPLVTASSGISIAGILAQSLPAFFKGKSPSDNYEGWATVNELPGQKEIKIDEHGGITPYKAGMQLDYVKSSDIIVPSMSTFNREIKNPDSDIFKRLSQRVEVETSDRVSMFNVSSQMDISPLKGMIESEIRRGFKNARIINNNKIVIEEPFTQY